MQRQLDWQRRGKLEGDSAGTLFARVVPMSYDAGAGGKVTRPSSLRRWWLAGSCLLLVSCLSPTMPLPPPATPNIDGPDATGNVVLSGHIDNASYVYVDNLSTGYSAGQVLEPETGNYRFSIKASIGDYMSMFYRVSADNSAARTFKIPAPSAAFTASGGASATGGAAATGGEAGSNSAPNTVGGATGVGTGGASTSSNSLAPSSGGAASGGASN